MRNTFKGFHNPSELDLKQAWRSDQTIFVFDTNVLLNLYGYAEQTRNDFFELLSALGDKVWIPYQVGLKYQRRRLEVIRDEKAIFTKINESLDKIDKIFKGDLEQLALKRRFPKLHDNTEKLQKEISKNVAAYKKSVSYWDDKQPCVRSHDFIREKLNDILEGKVGDKPLNQQWLDEIYKEGEERYKNKTPPGFKDANKSNSDDRTFFYDGLRYERQFGDLILWKQIIDKSSSEQYRNVIFVTDDAKDDWWYILESRGKKQIGPHAYLQNEIYRQADLDIFHMYNTSLFLSSGKEILNVGVHDSSIKDAGTTFSLSRITAEAITKNLINQALESNERISENLSHKSDIVEKYNDLHREYYSSDRFKNAYLMLKDLERTENLKNIIKNLEIIIAKDNKNEDGEGES